MIGRNKTFLVIAGFLIVFSCTLEAWVFHGPYGGSVDQFLFHPTNSQIVFLHNSAHNSDYGYLYRSINGGETWKRLKINTGGVKIHPKDPTGFYAVFGDTLFRSFDSGNTWKKLANAPFKDETIYDFAIHPSNPNMLYVISEVHPQAGADFDTILFSTTDGGKTWVRRSKLKLREVERMAVDPNNGNTIYLIGIIEGGIHLYKSIDGGFNWASSEFGHFLTSFLAIDPKNSQNIYIGGDLGFVKSTNGGRSFNAVSCNCSPNDLSFDPKTRTNLYVAGGDGLWRSSDSGDTWTSVKLPLTNYSFGPKSVSVSPSNPDILFTGSGNIGFGIYKSMDRGGTWKSRNRGLDARNIDRVKVNSMLQNDIFAASTGVLLHSLDGGDSWSRIKIDGVRDVTFLLRHPVNPNFIFVANNVFGQFAVSTDNGKTWQSKKFPFQYLGAIALHPVDQKVIYAAGEKGLFRSDDGGTTWQKLVFNAPETVSIGISTSNPQLILTLAGEYGRNKVFKSEDAGKSWRTLNVPVIAGQIVINPQNDQIIYVFGDIFINNKLAKSVDGGNSWIELSVPDNLGLVQIDPSKIDHIFTAQDFSFDGGKTWKKFDHNGLSPAITYYQDLDIVPAHLYISTDNGIYSHQIP